MKKIILGILVLLLATTYAKQISQEQSLVVAQNFFLEKIAWSEDQTAWKESPTWGKPLIVKSRKSDRNLCYIYNTQNREGFIIVAGDDRVTPVLGYSLNNPFSADYQKKSNIAYWLKNYTDQIDYIIEKRIEASAETHKLWERYTALDFAPNKQREEAIILISAKWGQDKYYNQLCPDDPQGADGHARVGCVATAMSQIMYYHQYPDVGRGESSYHASGYGELYVNYGESTYNYQQMADYIDDYNFEIAQIGMHAGVAVEMMYGAHGSGAYSANVPSAMINHFRYSNEANLVDRYSKSSRDWAEILKTEINALRPLYYSGAGDHGGHAFICDGYQGEYFFHFNWGWEGTYNGFFNIQNLAPGTMSFNDGQSALVELYPDSLPQINFEAEIQNIKTGSKVSFKDISKYHPSQWNWTFEGADPSSSEEQNPQNIFYNTPGTYSVTLSATNWNGTKSYTKTNYIVVADDALPVADFETSAKYPATEEIVLLTDLSLNSPTQWNWEFSPNTVSFHNSTDANSQNPAVSFNEATVYTVKLIAANSAGNNEIIKKIYAGGKTLPYSENWEIAIWKDEWEIENPDSNITWEGFYKLEGYGDSRKSAWIDYFRYSEVGQRDRLISPLLNLKNMGTAQLDFMYAYAEYNATRSDSLIIKISTDNGSNWERILALGENGYGSFATHSPMKEEFVPKTRDDWAGSGFGANPVSLDLTPWTKNANVRIMFESYNGHGNSLYLDDLALTGEEMPTDNYDAQIVEIISPKSLYTEGATEITPQIVIKNRGLEELNSLKLECYLNNNNVYSGTWTGNLETFKKDTLSLPPMTLEINPRYTYEVVLSKPNGNSDANSEDNSLVKEFGVVELETIYLDNFENDLNNWEIEEPWAITTENSYEGNSSVTDSPNGDYGISESNSITSPEINLVNYENATLSFFTRYEIEEDFDYVYLEISSDNGSTWKNLKSFTGEVTAWKENLISLAEFQNQKIKIRFRLESDNYISGDGIYIDNFKITGSYFTGIEENTPREIKLYQNYPNPFNPETKINFYLANAQKINLSVFNYRGQKVAELANGAFKKGLHSVKFNALNLSSGVYFYKLKTSNDLITKKMILIK